MDHSRPEHSRRHDDAEPVRRPSRLGSLVRRMVSRDRQPDYNRFPVHGTFITIEEDALGMAYTGSVYRRENDMIPRDQVMPRRATDITLIDGYDEEGHSVTTFIRAGQVIGGEPVDYTAYDLQEVRDKDGTYLQVAPISTAELMSRFSHDSFIIDHTAEAPANNRTATPVRQVARLQQLIPGAEAGFTHRRSKASKADAGESDYMERRLALYYDAIVHYVHHRG